MNGATLHGLSVAPVRAYRYARFSHSRQAEGMSLERQADVAEAWAAQRGMSLDDAFVDAGVSASKGKNLARGALWRFRQAVGAGDVPAGSYLLVESVSRFSRLAPDDMRPVLRELVEAGLTVVFFDPSVEVTAENFNSMQVGMVLSIMSYIAKDYADTLGRYKVKAWEKAREGMRSGVVSTRALPFWLTCDAVPNESGRPARGSIKPHPLYAPIVERIFRDYLAGSGKGEIAAQLNADKVPGPVRTGFKAGATFWRHGLIGRTLANEAVTGIFQPHKEIKARITLKSGIEGALKRKREPVGEPIPGYFPEIISPELFAQAAQLRAQKRTKAGALLGSRSGPAHILARLACCPVCGSAMLRSNKGKKRPPRYVCTRALSRKKGACDRVYVVVADVERALIDNAALLASSAPGADIQSQAQLAALDIDADAIVTALEAGSADMARALESNEPVPRAERAALVALESRLDAISQERAVIAQRAAAFGSNVIRNRVQGLLTALESYRIGMEQVQAVNATLYECFARAVIDYRTGEVIMHWRHGPPPTVIKYYDAAAELVKEEKGPAPI